MNILARRRSFVALLLGTLAIFASPSDGRADLTVDQGYDLLQTLPGTSFMGVDFKGVPYGTFDFGAPFGVHNVGNADTIVHRLSDATVSGPGMSASIDTELVGLQLESTAPTDFGLGVGFYFVTLQSARGGPASPGTMTIAFDPNATASNQFGTFSSFFDIFFDIRKDSLNGPIALSSELTLSSSDNPWNHVAPPGAFLIDGVNNNLNGTNNLNDFWPGGLPVGPPVQIVEVHPGGLGAHVVTTATPEPGSFVLVGMGAIGLAGYRWRRRAKSA